ncbi:hypothetical protein CCACVL1_30071, partial [Corchorus capsularis]
MAIIRIFYIMLVSNLALKAK